MRSNKTQTFFGAARDTQKKLPLFERPGRSHSFWVFFFFSFFFLFSCWQPHIFKNVRVRYEPERKERREEWTDVFFLPKTIRLKSQRSRFTLRAVYERPHIA